MLFVMGIAPLSIVQLPWLGVIAGEAYLLKQEFNASFLEIIQLKLRLRQA
jgi:hypothetical protein